MPNEEKEITVEDIKKPTFDASAFLKVSSNPNKPSDIKPDPEPAKKDEKKSDEAESPAPEKKTKEDNAKALRQAKEAAERELADLKKENEKLKKLKSLEKISNYLSEKKGGEFTEEDVEEYIKRNKDRKGELENLRNDYIQKEAALKEFSIEHSDEWKNHYHKNIQESSALLRTTIINVSGDGAIRAPIATQKFMTAIASLKKDGDNVRPLNPLEIKSELSKFKKEFEEEAGVDYEAPGLTDLVKASENFHKDIDSANRAKQNWGKAVEDRKKAKLYEESKQRELESKQELEGRNFLVSKLKEDEGIKNIRTYVEDIDTFIKEEHGFMTDVYLGKDVTLRGYDSLVSALAKAKASDKLIEALKAKDAEIKKLRDQIDGDSSRSHGSNSRAASRPKEDGDIKLKPGEQFDATAFLRA